MMKELKPIKEGKVREIYDNGDSLIMVATDRISCFDVILNNVVTKKGTVLTQMSKFWFDLTEDILPNHMISVDTKDMPEFFQQEKYEGKSMMCKKLQMLPIECIVRGYITGSGWSSYKKNGTVCGQKLRPGYRQAEKLDEAIFTPSTKADEGHDENISFDEACKLVGVEKATRVKELALRLYNEAAAHAEKCGIILADTKFEFGEYNGEVIVIDEVLTPDSSRFWPKDQYQIGGSPASLDKQFVRDYLESLDWDKTPPAPALPEEIVVKTREKYLDALKALSGKSLS